MQEAWIGLLLPHLNKSNELITRNKIVKWTLNKLHSLVYTATVSRPRKHEKDQSPSRHVGIPDRRSTLPIRQLDKVLLPHFADVKAADLKDDHDVTPDGFSSWL